MEFLQSRTTLLTTSQYVALTNNWLLENQPMIRNTKFGEASCWLKKLPISLIIPLTKDFNLDSKDLLVWSRILIHTKMPTMTQSDNPSPATLPPVAAPPAGQSAPTKRTKHMQCELIHIIEIMHSILLIGPHEWDLVVEPHTSNYQGRDEDSIRRKYTSLYRKKFPTGHHNIPPEVRLTRRVKHLLATKQTFVMRPMSSTC